MARERRKVTWSKLDNERLVNASFLLQAHGFAHMLVMPVTAHLFIGFTHGVEQAMAGASAGRTLTPPCPRSRLVGRQVLWNRIGS